MGRQSAIGGLMGKAADAKAAKRRKKMGPGSFLRGKPGDDFLAQLQQRQSAAQESARNQLTQRLQSGERGGIFSRLFGLTGGARRR